MESIVQTYRADIYLGLSPGYNCRIYFNAYKQIIQSYINKVGLGVTITKTRFHYTNGSEKGIIVGLINYPRYPSTKKEIQQHAVNLAWLLKDAAQQLRVSVVCSDVTIMIE